MTILTKNQLETRLKDNLNRRLVIKPLLDPEKQIGQASIDLRLSNEFIIIRNTNFTSVDPSQKDKIRENIGQYQERIRISYGEDFVLHPNQLVLGSTLEYISMPIDLTAQVIGRSSWGRLGLIIATATMVSPGFKGAITLELINAGQVPLILNPGFIIAQLLIAETSSDTDIYKGRYNFPTGPEFSKIHEEKVIEFWGDESNFDL